MFSVTLDTISDRLRQKLFTANILRGLEASGTETSTKAPQAVLHSIPGWQQKSPATAGLDRPPRRL